MLYLAARECAKDLHHAVETEVIGDEIRRVFRDDDALPEAMVRDVADRSNNRRVGVRSRDDFEQPQVSRRIEEMRAEGVRLEIRRAAVDDSSNRNARCVGADDGVGPAVTLDALEQRLLDIQTLDDRFDDPVAARHRGEVLVKAAGTNQRRGRTREQRIRLESLRSFEPLACGLRRDVEQEDRQPGIGEVRCDLRTHRACAEDRCLADLHVCERVGSGFTRFKVHEVRGSQGSQVQRSGAQSSDQEIDDLVRLSRQRVSAAAENPVRGHLVERAKEQLGGQRRVDVAPEDLLRLTVDDDVADDPEGTRAAGSPKSAP